MAAGSADGLLRPAAELDRHAASLADDLMSMHQLRVDDGAIRLKVKSSVQPEATAVMGVDGPEISISQGLINQLAILTLNMAEVAGPPGETEPEDHSAARSGEVGAHARHL